MKQIFLVIHNQSRFERIHKTALTETVIGRDASCGIALVDPVISRKHAMFFVSETDCRILDLRSRNGTRVDGVPVLGEVTIVDGSKVEIGPFVLRVCFDLAGAISTSQDGDDSTQSGTRACKEALAIGTQSLALTVAQRRVYDLLMMGLIEKEVATRLGISPHTVHDHSKAIYRALSVSTRGELLARAISQHG